MSYRPTKVPKAAGEQPPASLVRVSLKEFERVQNSVAMMHRVVWDTADKFLRNSVGASEYGDFILPFTVLRRLECLLDVREERTPGDVEEPPTLKQCILNYTENTTLPEGHFGDMMIRGKFNVSYYSTSPLSLNAIRNSEDSVKEAMYLYLDSFNEPIREIWQAFDFHRSIATLDQVGQLWNMVDHFASIDLHPDNLTDTSMGDLFEDLMYRSFSTQGKDAGEFYTPRDAIELMVDIVFNSDDKGLTGRAPARSVYDPTAGTGGMLLVAKRALEELNPNIDVALYGQEKMPKSWALGSADLLIQGASTGSIAFGNTLEDDKYQGQHFDYILANPPYGSDWSSSKAAVQEEAAQPGSRFSHGLPPVSDGQMLFLSHIVDKLSPPGDNGAGGRGAVVMNGSPLFTGGPESGPDSIRAWLLTEDLVDAIIALPTDMFYNTGISTYIWIVDRNKEPHRQGYVQLIDATSLFTPMRKGMGQKRRELSEADRQTILDAYKNFEDSDISRVMTADDLGFKDVPVHRLHHLRTSVTEETITAAFTHKDATEDHRAVIEAMGGIEFNDLWKKLKTAAKQHDVKMGAPLRRHIVMSLGVEDATAPESVDEKGNPLIDTTSKMTERIPLTEDVDEHMQREVIPFAPDAVWDEDKARTGYEIPFTRIFYQPEEARSLEEIDSSIAGLMSELSELFQEVRE